MKLADARKMSLKQGVRIRFRLAGGRECVLNERGVAEVPGLNVIPDFNLSDEFANAAEFIIEPVGAGPARTLGREQLAAMMSPSAPEPVHHDDE